MSFLDNQFINNTIQLARKFWSLEPLCEHPKRELSDDEVLDYMEALRWVDSILTDSENKDPVITRYIMEDYLFYLDRYQRIKQDDEMRRQDDEMRRLDDLIDRQTPSLNPLFPKDRKEP